MNDLKRYLSNNDETQEQFAERVGVKQATISRILRGKAQPSPELAIKIQDATQGKVPWTGWSKYQPLYLRLSSDALSSGGS